jgi:hypothetical protein
VQAGARDRTYLVEQRDDVFQRSQFTITDASCSP